MVGNVIDLISRSMKKWRTNLYSDSKFLGTVKSTEAYFRGVIFSLFLFVIALIQVTHTVRDKNWMDTNWRRMDQQSTTWKCLGRVRRRLVQRRHTEGVWDFEMCRCIIEEKGRCKKCIRFSWQFPIPIWKLDRDGQNQIHLL